MINGTLAKPLTPETSTQVLALSDRSLASTRRLSALLRELLDLTRIRVGQLTLNRQICDLTSIVQESVAQLAAEAAKNGSPISIEANRRVTGSFDSTRISQVIVHLVSNAIKYGNGKPIRVFVGMRESKAVVVVQDHGIGIPANKLPHLFHRYERFEARPINTRLGFRTF